MIRMRTEGGAQMIMNDDCGYIHMTSSDGASWAQLTDNGVQYFTEGSIAMRVQGNYNMRVDGNYASETLGETSFKVGGTFNITTDGGYNVRDNGDGIKLEAVGFYGMKTETNSIQESEGIISQKAAGNIVKHAAVIMKNTETGYVAEEVAPLQIGQAVDRQQITTDSGVERQQTTRSDTTLPDGGLTGHEPWAGQGQACGKPTEPSEAQEAIDDAVENGEFTEGVDQASAEDLNALNDMMIADGLTKEQRAAALGAFVTESAGLNTRALGDGGRSLGLAQWNGSRRDGLMSFAAAGGGDGDPFSLATQYSYVKHEMGIGNTSHIAGFGTERKAGNMFSNATTLDGAMAGLKQYERYGVAGRRYTLAQQFYGMLR